MLQFSGTVWAGNGTTRKMISALQASSQTRVDSETLAPLREELGPSVFHVETIEVVEFRDAPPALP